MQEIRSSNPLVVTSICDPNKSRARHHRSLKLGSKVKYLNKNNTWFKKDTEEIVLLPLKGLIQIIVKFKVEKILFTFLLSTKHPFLRGTKYHAPKRLYSNTLKRNELKVYISLKENIWTRIYLHKEGTSKHSRKKIMQLLSTVVTYLLKKCWTWNWTWYW